MTPTPEQVAQWAREAGVKAGEHFEFRGGYEEMPVLEQREFDAVYRFATRVAAWQAEQDAKVCEAEAKRAMFNFQRDLKINQQFWQGAESLASSCADHIRANAPKGTT